MEIVRHYIDNKSFLNYRVRRVIEKESDLGYVLQTKPDELMVASIERTEMEAIDKPELGSLLCDMQAFEWLFSDRTRTACVSLTLNNEIAYDIAKAQDDFSLLNVTCIVIDNMRVVAEITGRLDGVIGFALSKAIKYQVPIIVSDKHQWDFLADYIRELRVNVKLDLVSHEYSDEIASKYRPIPTSMLRAKYGRTLTETATLIGGSTVILGLAFLGYTTYHDAQVKEQPEVVQRIVKDPYKQYRDEIRGHHVTQDVNFAVKKFGEFEKLPNWYVQSIDIHEDGTYRLTFKPKFSVSSLTELVQWMRKNSNEKLQIQSNDYFAVSTMPAFKHDYMSAFKRYIIDTQLNFAQFKDLALYSGFNNVSLNSNVNSTNFKTMIGSITANQIELSQVKSFYDQLAQVPISDQGLRIQKDLNSGFYSINQQYKLIGRIDK
ncbi:TPA: hypothetical protein ACX6RO_001861 [Photobacterium damselae]